MSNHCLNVYCAGCGACWCFRGCNYDCSGDEDSKNIAQKRKEEDIKIDGECHYCGSEEVYIGNLYKREDEVG
jgi:hypothetical protein